MSTLVYSPGIEVLIDTLDRGIIDVSEDISRGSLTLTENFPSTLNLSIINHRRKYDGLFTPNDIVVVKLKRLAWLPVFAGYLDEVPYYSVYPRTVKVSATDTLKRLQMRVWDKGSQAAYALLTSTSGTGITQVDGGIRDKVISVLTEIAGWDKSKIHIGAIPNDWAERLEPLRQKLADQISMNVSDLGMSGVVAGSSLLALGTDTVESDGPGTGVLPATSGRVEMVTTTSRFTLTGETKNNARDPWYIAMRWPYQTNFQESQTPEGDYMSTSDKNAAMRWWKGRKILVVNPLNNQGACLRVADWGPPQSSGRVAEVSEHVLHDVLGAVRGANMEYRFAPTTMALGVAKEPSEHATRPPKNRPPAPTPTEQPILPSESGSNWTARDDLQPHTAACYSFVKGNWDTGYGIGGYAYRTIGGTGKLSDHAKGLALDVMVTKLGNRAQGAEESMGNAIAMWFAANPKVFGIKYIIWMDRINTGSGWRRYGHPSGSSGNTEQHRDHVHLSFEATSQTSAGPMGDGWPGGTPADFNNNVATDNGHTPGAGSGIYSGLVGPNGMPLLNAFAWSPVPDPWSLMLSGPRQLLNDTPLLPSVAELVQASMRSFMAAPNGDFMAWFPDYFGIYGTASKIVVRDIELIGEGFTVAWNDSHLVTHQFTAGTTTGYTTVQPGAPVTQANILLTQGIATVEYPELMEALFNVGPGARGKYFRDAEAILQRFGARVNFKPMTTITGPEAEFWYAVSLFQKAWASQFSSQISLSFLPEVWPGMLLELESFKFQAYVEQVTHSWDFSDEAGFSTSVRVIAPSTTDKSGFYALPLAGEIEPPRPIALHPGTGGPQEEL